MHNYWQRNQTQYSFPQTLVPLKMSIIKNTSTVLMLPKLSMNPDHRHQSPILIHIPPFFSNGSCKNNFFHFFPCLNMMRLKLYNFVLDFWGQDSCLKLQAFSDFGLQDLKCWFLTPWLLFQHTQIQHTLAQLCEMEWGCPSGWDIENSRINALLLEKKHLYCQHKKRNTEEAESAAHILHRYQKLVCNKDCCAECALQWWTKKVPLANGAIISLEQLRSVLVVSSEISTFPLRP